LSTVLHDFRVVAERLAFSPADGRALFSDITLGFGRERTGLTGPNGSGKTTLARLLTGELRPTAGTVRRRGTLAYLPQDFQVHADRPLAAVLGIAERLAALDRVYAGAGLPDDLDRIGDDWDLRERAEALLARFGLGHLPLDRPAADVSGGEATRVALAGLLLGRPDFLVLDEPTNNLDSAGREALYGFAEGWTGGMLVISHDRALLSRMDRILELSGLARASMAATTRRTAPSARPRTRRLKASWPAPKRRSGRRGARRGGTANGRSAAPPRGSGAAPRPASPKSSSTPGAAGAR
jgi:ATPase subunit of ABC transporter with duplicated ATPase domains